MKKIIYLIIAAAIVGGAALVLTQIIPAPEKVSAIDSNTTLEGNQEIAKGEKLLIKKDAIVTVNGDLAINGTLECDGGSLNLIVNGNLVVDKNLTCNIGQPGTAIAIVVAGSAIFNESAAVTADGNVQIVDSVEKLVQDSDQLNKLFEAVESDSGSKIRIGPFVMGNGADSSLPELQARNTSRKIYSSAGLAMITPVAKAQAPEPCVDNAGKIVPNCVRIGGRWIIGTGETPPSGLGVSTPPKGVKKIILNFDFGPASDFRIEDFALSGPNGRHGENDISKSCNAKGGNGEDAFRVRITAGNVTIDDFELWLGDGGRGGNAETIKNCDPGNATGGNGGKPGNLKIEAANSLNIVGAFIIHPGYGGNGGRAAAYGRDGINACPGQNGGDAKSTGGNGADNKKDLRALGSITGIKNVSVSSTRGGDGGEAIANPGKGGGGTTCGCAGGNGGKGTAIGGKGGNANLVVLGAAVETTGGNGGDADSHGGNGGSGGMCNAEGPGGNGGSGGNAISTKGAKGTGKAPGEDGVILDETGGNGGIGGDGCPEGQGGKGGKGNPNGNNGGPGKNLCPLPGTSKPEIPTEIIQMQLQGTTPIPQPPIQQPTPANEEPRSPGSEFPTQDQTAPSYYQ